MTNFGENEKQAHNSHERNQKLKILVSCIEDFLAEKPILGL